MPSDRNRIQFECPEQLAAQLRAYVEHTGLGLSEVVRIALTDYLAQREYPRPGERKDR